MGESLLKKEFKPSDVSRIRNLITGKDSSSTKVQVGYDKKSKHQKHKEGEIWEEDGRKWIIKNGTKQSFNKKSIQSIIPLFCPSCGKIMNKKTDKTIYKQHGKCLDCRVVEETKIRIDGRWKEYEKTLVETDIDQLIEEYTLWFDEELKTSAKYYTEDGEEETWHGTAKNKLLDQKQETINFLLNLKKSFSKES